MQLLNTLAQRAGEWLPWPPLTDPSCAFLIPLSHQPDNAVRVQINRPVCTILQRPCGITLYVATFTFAIILLLHSATRYATTRARQFLVDTALATGLVGVRAVTVAASVAILTVY
jgi:hypothetical protein